MARSRRGRATLPASDGAGAASVSPLGPELHSDEPIDTDAGAQGGTCFVIELPWDIAVPDDHKVPVYGAAATGAVGPSQTVYDLLGAQPRPGQNLEGWFAFRTVQVATQRPLEAADRAFGTIDRDIARSRRIRWVRAMALRIVTSRPHVGRRTVVAAYDFRAPRDPSAEELTVIFTEVIERLNDYLISLGVKFDDRLRPIAPGDLPPVVPFMAVAVDAVGRLWHGTSRRFVLRDPPGSLRIYGSEELTDAELMFDIVRTRAGLATFYEVVQRAGSARRANRDREAVIDYATAGELFITEILRRVGPLAGIEEAKLARIVDGPFRDRVMHLCRSLGFPLELDDHDSPLFFWWMHCYRPRNEIVHAGGSSHELFSELARIGLVTLVCGVRDALRADTRMAGHSTDIQWGFVVDETGAGESSFPDPLT